ncbi:MAG: hypothetical protein R2726_23160 [Acidimicrobiales bacterium]
MDAIGPALIVIALLVVIPVAVMLSGAVVAAVLGMFLKKDADERNEGTEYLALGG